MNQLICHLDNGPCDGQGTDAQCRECRGQFWIGRFMLAEPVGTAPFETYLVKNKRSNAPLGTVEYYRTWGEYVLDPERGATFSYECLLSLAEFCRQLNSPPHSAKNLTEPIRQVSKSEILRRMP